MIVTRHDVNLPAVCVVCGHPAGVHYPGCRGNRAHAEACQACGAREGEVHAAGCSSPWATFSVSERGAAPRVIK